MTYHQRFASTLCAAFDDARALGGTITALVRWNAAVRYIVMVG